MDVFGAMRTFRQVVTCNGFAAAARQLGRATSSVSRQIGELESELRVPSVRIARRATSASLRPVRSITNVPHGFWMRWRKPACRRSVGWQSERRAAGDHADGIGREIISVALPEFLARHGGVRVVLSVTDAMLNLVDAGIDVAIRMGPQKDSTLIARKIGSSRRIVCASPAYLKRAGVPRHPEDLVATPALRGATIPAITHGPFAVQTASRMYRSRGTYLCAAPMPWPPRRLRGLG